MRLTGHISYLGDKEKSIHCCDRKPEGKSTSNPRHRSGRIILKWMLKK
jgi:hypothetical protein